MAWWPCPEQGRPPDQAGTGSSVAFAWQHEHLLGCLSRRWGLQMHPLHLQPDLGEGSSGSWVTVIQQRSVC